MKELLKSILLAAPEQKTCGFCGLTWQDSHPDMSESVLWCGECDRTKVISNHWTQLEAYDVTDEFVAS